MERIKQKIAEPIAVVPFMDVIYIEQDEDTDGLTDVIQVEKQSIPALIAALQKYAG